MRYLVAPPRSLLVVHVFLCDCRAIAKGAPQIRVWVLEWWAGPLRHSLARVRTAPALGLKMALGRRHGFGGVRGWDGLEGVPDPSEIGYFATFSVVTLLTVSAKMVDGQALDVPPLSVTLCTDFVMVVQ